MTTTGREAEIQEMVDRETRAWDSQDAEALVSIFHPDMVWPWPPHNDVPRPGRRGSSRSAGTTGNDGSRAGKISSTAMSWSIIDEKR